MCLVRISHISKFSQYNTDNFIKSIVCKHTIIRVCNKDHLMWICQPFFHHF